MRPNRTLSVLIRRQFAIRRARTGGGAPGRGCRAPRPGPGRIEAGPGSAARVGSVGRRGLGLGRGDGSGSARTGSGSVRREPAARASAAGSAAGHSATARWANRLRSRAKNPARGRRRRGGTGSAPWIRLGLGGDRASSARLRPRAPAPPRAPPPPAPPRHGLSRLLGLHLRGQRHPRSPSRRLDPHRAARTLALPGDGGLGLEPGDRDLSELAQVAGERGGVAAFGPQLGWGLDQGPACLVLCHGSGFARPRRLLHRS